MDPHDNGQLDSLIASVEVEIDEEAELAAAPAGRGDVIFQERLAQQLQVAQESLGKNLSIALEMVKGRLESTRSLEDELSRLRQEKERLVAELATLRSDSVGKCAVVGSFSGCSLEPPTLVESVTLIESTAAEESPDGSQASDDLLGFEPGVHDRMGSLLSSGTTASLSFPIAGLNSARQSGEDLFKSAAFGPRQCSSLEESMLLINPIVSEPPPLPNAVESPLAEVSKGIFRPKSAIKDKFVTPAGSRRGSDEVSEKCSAAKQASQKSAKAPTIPLPSCLDLTQLAQPRSRAGSPTGAGAAARRESTVSIMLHAGLVVEPGQNPSKPPKEVLPKGLFKRLGSMEEDFEDELEEDSNEDEDDEDSGRQQDYDARPSQITRTETGLTAAGLELADFALAPIWWETYENEGSNLGGDKTGQIQRKLSEMMFDYSSLEKGVMTLRDEDDDLSCLMSFFLHFMVNPSSRYRISWDICSFLLLAYDMITLPLLGAFDPKVTGFLTFMVWFTRLFWTFDILASCVTGFMRKDGVVEMRPVQIWMRYARTWMVLDLALVGIDWVELFVSLDSTIDVARLGKASRGFRILRLLRLLRLLRFGSLMQYIDERIRSDRLMILADIVKFVLLIILSAHFAACAWYGIGGMAAGKTWVSEHIDSVDESTPISLRYLMSLHWALSQFAGGMSEFLPQNLGERLYVVILFIFAFMMAAVLVSSLTSEITRVQIIANTHAQQLSILRRFLTDKNVSTKLAVRVQRNARHALQEQQRHIPEAAVELLILVSEPLRVELHFEMQSPLLSKHPFFAQYIEECPHIMRKVIHKCTKVTACFAGDVIFNPGEVPNPAKMYFVANGSFEYFLMSGQQVRVCMGTWLSEPVLWTNWCYRGGLRTKGDSHLCELYAEPFQKVCVEFDHNYFDPRAYGIKFVELLNHMNPNLSDLPMPREVLEEASGTLRVSEKAGADVLRSGSGGRLLAAKLFGNRSSRNSNDNGE